jgi:hypothetical protein
MVGSGLLPSSVRAIASVAVLALLHIIGEAAPAPAQYKPNILVIFG